MTRVAVAAGLVVLAGCGGPGRVAVHPVAGRVEVNDRPAAGARVAFHPVDPGRAGGAYPVGVAGPDGTFALTTFKAGDGAPAGEYVVTVFWENDAMPLDECVCPDPTRHDRLFGLYADARTSGLRATVGPGANAITLRPAAGGRGWNLPPLVPDARPRPEPERADTSARAQAERERAGGGR